MPLDHYVSQVHLKNFCASDGDGLLRAIRKSDLKLFPTKPSDICRIEDNSTNAYLKEDRAIEEFLKGVEPGYNASLTKIREGKIDKDCIHAIAGFVAYVMTCSPTAMRINTGPLRDMVEAATRVIDAQGKIPNAPPSLGGKSATQLLADGTIAPDIDPKYPQALGISNILHHTAIFGNSPWQILHNGETDSPFFTSDFPVAMEVTPSSSVIIRVVPLAPDLAIRIKPDIRLSGTTPDLNYSGFSSTRHKLKRTETVALNRLFVRSAEDLVLYDTQRAWIKTFVAKNRYFHIEAVSQTQPYGTGHLINPTQRIIERPPNQGQPSMS